MICNTYILTEDFIRKYQDRVNWDYISRDQILSESFIIEFKDKIRLKYITVNQKLSEEFIENHSFEIDWISVFGYQDISEEFIWRHKDKEGFKQLYHNRNLKYFSQKLQYEILKCSLDDIYAVNEHMMTDYMKSIYNKIKIFA
jgi:hypothetical protein